MKFLFFLLTFSSITAFAQTLQPGFSKHEATQMLRLSARVGTDTSYFTGDRYLPEPDGFTRVYRSKEMGLSNLWELWSSGLACVIHIRGTVGKSESWLANIYSAMVPATGRFILAEQDTFFYHLSDHPNAAVHTGWLLSTAYLSRDILPRIDSCYQAGIQNFFITGHSQGGGITYMLTAYLYGLQKEGKLPSDLRFKTYATAAPKPGNTYFAYSYEAQTKGWAFNIVSSADWVPEVPVSVQNISDINEISPFPTVKEDIASKQKWPKRAVIKMAANRLIKPSEKARANYIGLLGDRITQEVQKTLPEFRKPEFYPSIHYVRTGQMVVLYAEGDYFEQFPNDPEDVWKHHMHHPYLYLLDGYEP
ncbi:MAG TPA: lipase [Flavobacteriales bacterium]|nr:lipase [Flavobacteriales bacterium]